MAPLQSAVTNTSVVKGWQLESGGIISQGTGANIAAVTATAWAWERRKQASVQFWEFGNNERDLARLIEYLITLYPYLLHVVILISQNYQLILLTKYSILYSFLSTCMVQKFGDYNSWERDIIERTHVYFSKRFWGVNKQCPNVACINELGRLPFKGKTNHYILITCGKFTRGWYCQTTSPSVQTYIADKN